MLTKMVCEEVIGELAGLLEAIDCIGDFEVDPVIMDVCIQILLINKFAGKVGEFDLDVLWVIKRGTKVEVFDVKAGKFGTWVGGG